MIVRNNAWLRCVDCGNHFVGYTCPDGICPYCNGALTGRPQPSTKDSCLCTATAYYTLHKGHKFHCTLRKGHKEDHVFSYNNSRR